MNKFSGTNIRKSKSGALVIKVITQALLGLLHIFDIEQLIYNTYIDRTLFSFR